MKILITGSKGMLGTDFCQLLLDRDYEFVGTDIKEPGGGELYDYQLLDITKEDETKKIIHKIKPDLIVHAAAYTQVDNCEEDKDLAYLVNFEGTKNIALASKAENSFVVYLSTDYVFDGRKSSPYKEYDETNPLSIYGDSKLKGELAIKEILERYLIVRTSWLYGKNGSNFVDKIITKAKEVDKLRIVDDQEGSPTYTVDLSEALLRIIALYIEGKFNDERNLGVYHITNSGSCTWFEYAKEIVRLAGIDVEVEPITTSQLNAPAERPAYSVLDNSRFIDVSGFRMRDWQQALRDYLSPII